MEKKQTNNHVSLFWLVVFYLLPPCIGFNFGIFNIILVTFNPIYMSFVILKWLYSILFEIFSV